MGKSSIGRTHRREVFTKGRELRRQVTAKTAAAAIGPLAPGCEIYGLCKGQFSLIDIICHCLEASGPADVIISTWTAAGADIGFAYKLLTEGRINSCLFLVDFSFPSRQPAYCAALKETFGNECIRITKNHAKFVIVKNEAWALVIRSSMNLNENRRLESFEISEDKALADYLEAFINEIFLTQDPAGQLERRPIEHMQDFENLAELPPGSPAPGAGQAALDSTDAKRFYGNGPYDTDLRRTGTQYLK